MKQLHRRDIVRRVDEGLQSVINENADGRTLVIADKKDELDDLVPINDQQRIGKTDDRLTFNNETAICSAPTLGPHNDSEYHLPKNKEQRTHYEANSFESVILIFGKTGYMQRIRPFLDATRIAKKGGTILSITGLQPRKQPDHDAKWWVPNSQDCAALEEIVLTRSEDYKTPNLVSIHSVTSADKQNESATVVTSPQMEINNV